MDYMPILLIGLLVGIVLLYLFLSPQGNRHEQKNAEAAALYQRLGLAQSPAPYVGALHHEGVWKGSAVILGDYRGEDVRSYSTWWREEGTQVFMEVGGLPGLPWWVDLSNTPPEFHGSGEGHEHLAARLTPSVLAAVGNVRHARSIRLFPIEGRLSGGVLDLLFQSRPDWSGLTLHSLLPLDLPEEALRETLDQLAALRDAIRSV